MLPHRIITKYYEAQIQLKGYKLNDILRLDTTNAEGVILITTYDKTGKSLTYNPCNHLLTHYRIQ